MNNLKRGSISSRWFLPLLLSVFVAGCSGGDSGRDPILGGDGVAQLVPTVTAVSPIPNSVNVPANTRVVTAAFSKPIDITTITAANFSLTCPTGTGLAGAISYTAIGNVAALTLTNNMPANTVCTGTVTTGVRDTSGIALASNFIWTFTTGAAPDETPPTVSAVSPLVNATNVPLNTLVTASFSEPMNPLTITSANVKLACPATSPITATVGYTVLGNVATLTPASTLPASTMCTATITTGVRDVGGNAMVDPFVWTFTTGAAPDTTPPTVIATLPVANATGVPVNTMITATFSEAMNPLTITTANVKLACPAGTPVIGTVGYALNGSVMTFLPIANLPAGITCVGTILRDVLDVAGNPMASEFTWSFITSTASDTTPPTVTAVSPRLNDINVPTNTIITASFSEAMNPLSITTATMRLACPGTIPISGTVGYASAGSIATFTPMTALPASTTCTAVVTTGVRDVAGNATVSDYIWTFTTAAAPDTTAPTVSSTMPVANAQAVPVNTMVTATFSEAMNPLTITAANVRLACPVNTAITGTVSYALNGSVMTFTPLTNLPAGVTCTATILRDVRDAAGNAMVADFIWSFTTNAAADTTPPTVIAVSPRLNETNVPTNTLVTATFSEPMNAASFTGTTMRLACPAATPITGTVGYSGINSTVTFTPAAILPANTICTATITTGARDTAGNAMASDYVWSFTTAATPDAIAPTVISTNPLADATGVALDVRVTATFSEAMDPLTIIGATYRLACSATTNLTGIVTYMPSSNTATFVPGSNLPADTLCTATITTGVRDTSGNAMVNNYVWSFRTAASAQPPPSINLGSASTFGTFGGSAGVTNQGLLTIINGNIGTTAVSTAVTGLRSTLGGPACLYTVTPLNNGEVTGQIYTAPPPPTVGCPSQGTATTFNIATLARADALAAYNQLVAQPGGPDPLAGNLGSLVLAPGTYTAAAGSFRIQGGNLTLDAQGNANAVWVFQMATTLTVGGPGAAFPQSVTLVNGAQAKNVFWQVGTAATINAGGGGTMAGTIIAQSGVSISTAGNVSIVTLNGRALSLGASVTVVNTVINVPAP